MFGLSPQELFIVFLIILLLFGGKKIPEIARGLGKAMREFRKGVDDVKEDINRAAEEPAETETSVSSTAAPSTEAEVSPEPGDDTAKVGE